MAIRKLSTKSAINEPEKQTPTKQSNGRASVAKGRKFEDDVADLYRLQGAEVVQNIEVCNKKVDILVTFSYPVTHRVIVECKDESKVVGANQRVMQFHGLLTSARKAGEAESAEIITRVPWGDAAQGYANREGIRLLTYAEKIARLIDFTRYLKELVSKFDERDPARPSEPPLGKYYVDLSAVQSVKGTDKKIEVIDSYVHEWLGNEDTQQHLAIFGEYGAGKSTFCQKLARDLAVSFLRDPNSSRIPILLNLREFIGKLDIEAYITSFLDRECKVSNPKIDLFRAMNDAGIFLLIFDGLDEMAVKVDADTLESNLLEIDKLANSPNGKVILTSRTEFFVNAKEEQEAVAPATDPLALRKAKYDPIKILPWDENQVRKFLQRRVPLVEGATRSWTYYHDRITSIGNLSDLSQRPVLLDMIVKTLPVLIASNTLINRPNLYKTYLVGEIKRQKIQKRRKFLITEEDRLSLLRQLAVSVYNGDITVMNFADAKTRIEEKIKPPKYELDAHARDFLTNSFLIRNGDEYHFSHKSIMEYLVAAKFNEEIETEAPNDFGKSPLQPVILDFLKGFEPDADALFRLIDKTKEAKLPRNTFLGGNAATLLCSLSKDALARKDLSGTNLSGANLSLADLSEAKLDGTLLRGVNLTAARFSKEQLAGSSLIDSYFLFFCTSSRHNYRSDVQDATDKLKTIHQAGAGNLSTFRWRSIVEGDKCVLHCAMVNCPTGDILEETYKFFSDLFNDVALYADEYDRLVRKHPDFIRLIAYITSDGI